MKELFDKIEKLLSKKDRVVICLDGGAGSGKSTLASDLEKKFDATIIHMDDYFLPPRLRTEERLNSVGGNVDYERIYNEVFVNLKEDTININKFNCRELVLVPKEVKLGNLIVVEGVYSMRYEFREYYDLSVFLSIDSQLQLKRISERNGEKMLTRFVDEWIPMENEYFLEFKVKESVDLVISISK